MECQWIIVDQDTRRGATRAACTPLRTVYRAPRPRDESDGRARRRTSAKQQQTTTKEEEQGESVSSLDGPRRRWVATL